MPRLKEPLALTPDLVALVERFEPDPGPEPGKHDPSDAEFAAMAARCSKAPRTAISGCLPMAR